MICSSASAYSFGKGSSTDLQVFFSTSGGDKNLATNDAAALAVAKSGMVWAKSHGINLGSRTAKNVAKEIKFHALVYYYLPNIPFYNHGRSRWSRDAANPADVGNDDEYWGDYGPSVTQLAQKFM